MPRQLRNPTTAVLLAVIMAIAVSDIVWIRLDQSPPLWDIAGHSQRSVLYAQHLAQGNLLTVLRFDTIYPPFSYVVTSIGFLIAGWNADVPQYSLLLWVVLLGVAIYTLARSLYSHAVLAIVAVVVTFSYPLVAHFSRIYDLDFQQTAIVVAAIAALLKTQHFHNKTWSITFAILTGFALLTKWTSGIFLIAPILFVLIETMRRQLFDRRTILQLVLCLLVIFVIAGPWYLLHASAVLKSANLTRNNVFSVPYEHLFSVDNALYYFSQLVRHAHPMLIVFSGIGLIIAFIRRSRADFFVLASTIIPYLILTFALFSKESRYFLPVYPFIAILACLPISILKNWKRWTFVTVLVLIHLIIWMDTSWGTRLLPQKIYATRVFQSAYGYQHIRGDNPKYGFTTPTRYHTNLRDVVSAIQQDVALRNFSNMTIHIAVVPNSIFLTAQQIQFHARLLGLDTVNGSVTIDYSLSSKVRTADWREALSRADYVITKTGDQGPKIWGSFLPDVVNAENHPDESVFSPFTLLSTWELSGIESQPSEMRLYRAVRLEK
ncbi:MAG: glycosyltransferase family 39 protein [Candidatus Kerfeldbacteria bacterium]|nr:glycosyltransferase family 39 protein [Candidatus Kerfeldbacteria bacterium]